MTAAVRVDGLREHTIHMHIVYGTVIIVVVCSGVAMGWAAWAKSRGPPSERAPSSSTREKVIKRRRGKERVEWGRGPRRAVLAFLPRGPRVPSYATGCLVYS